MELIILASVVVAIFGGITIAWVLAQGDTKTAPKTPIDSDEAALAPEPDNQPDQAAAQSWTAAPGSEYDQAAMPETFAAPETADYSAVEMPVQEPSPTATRASYDRPAPVYVDQRRDGDREPRRTEIALPVNALQLNATEIIYAQIERLQAEYIRMDEERERLAQELLTSLLIEKIEGSAGRLRIETKKEAQDLRQQLSKVSADFERVQFRLASLEHLQERLDDPRVARQIEGLVKAVKQLARER